VYLRHRLDLALWCGRERTVGAGDCDLEEGLAPGSRRHWRPALWSTPDWAEPCSRRGESRCRPRARSTAPGKAAGSYRRYRAGRRAVEAATPGTRPTSAWAANARLRSIGAARTRGTTRSIPASKAAPASGIYHPHEINPQLQGTAAALGLESRTCRPWKLSPPTGHPSFHSSGRISSTLRPLRSRSAS